MPSIFQQHVADAYRDIFMSLDYFGEQVLVIKDLGRAEDIDSQNLCVAAAVKANQYIHCSISENEDDPIIGDAGFDRMDDVVVQCCRDEAAVNSSAVVIGGIASPNIHTGILRSVELDPEQRPYLFTHEAKNATAVLWRLVFRRRLQGTRGIV
jgi:hypothetical protein